VLRNTLAGSKTVRRRTQKKIAKKLPPKKFFEKSQEKLIFLANIKDK